MLRSVIHTVLWLAGRTMLIFHLPMFLYYKLKTPKRCPAVYDDVFFIPATILAEKIRLQEMSSVYVVSKYINRAQEVNKVINAIVQDRFEKAMSEAEHADAFVASSGLTLEELRDKYPLLGVPLTVKECIAVADMSNAAGSYITPKIAVRDAEVVKIVKAAGAIIYLVSNTPELCMSWESFNYVTGRTLNPYDTRRTCGGSSGGEAALVASGGSLIGIGSDMVGSGRGPPSFCGVYGHRTSAHLISTDSHVPQVDHHALSICPITRYAIDLPLMLRCMMPSDKVKEIKLLEEIEPRTIRVYYQFDSGSNFPTSPVNQQIKEAMKRLVKVIDDDGFFTKQVQIKTFADQFDIAFLTLFDIKGAYEEMSYRKYCPFWELLKKLVCCSYITLTVLSFEIFHFFYKLLVNDKVIERNRKLLDEMKAELEEMLGDDGVLLYPTFPNVAHVHGKIMARSSDTCYMAIFNALDFPCTIVPIGQDTDGLPIGIQIVSKQRNDRLSITLARYLETRFGGWVPPPSSVAVI